MRLSKSVFCIDTLTHKRRSEVIEPTKGLRKETGQFGVFNDEKGAQSRVNTNRNRLVLRIKPLFIDKYSAKLAPRGRG